MSTKLSAFKRARTAAKRSMGPQRYGVQGKVLTCHFCGHDRFTETFIGISSISGLVCSQCSHLELFMKVPEMMSPK